MTDDVAHWWVLPAPTPPWLPWVALVLAIVASGLLARAVVCGS